MWHNEYTGLIHDAAPSGLIPKSGQHWAAKLLVDAQPKGIFVVLYADYLVACLKAVPCAKVLSLVVVSAKETFADKIDVKTNIDWRIRQAMGWKDEIRNGPIQSVAAIVTLVGCLLSVVFYFANRQEDLIEEVSVTQDSANEDSQSRLVVEVELPDLPPSLPRLDSDLPPKPKLPPFIEEKLPASQETGAAESTQSSSEGDVSVGGD